MSRPRSESEYLARLLPPSVAAAGLSRRGFLKGTLGAGAAVSLSSLLAACGGGDDGDSGSASKKLSFGSNQSDEVPKKAYAEMTSAFQQKSGLTVKTNTVEHEVFQENINNYLQGNPDDVFTWFAGYRMRFFAAQGLAGDISDVLGRHDRDERGDEGRLHRGGRQAVLRAPDTYPWGLFYRKSVWQEKGYEPPETLDQLVAALPPVALLGALELLMSVARTGLPHTSRTPPPTQPAPNATGVALDRTPSGNGYRTPATVVTAALEDRTTVADPDTAAAPDARSQVRSLVVRERAGGSTVTAAEVMAVTGRSRRRAYELLRDARAEWEGTA